MTKFDIRSKRLADIDPRPWTIRCSTLANGNISKCKESTDLRKTCLKLTYLGKFQYFPIINYLSGWHSSCTNFTRENLPRSATKSPFFTLPCISALVHHTSSAQNQKLLSDKHSNGNHGSSRKSLIFNTAIHHLRYNFQKSHAITTLPFRRNLDLC